MDQKCGRVVGRAYMPPVGPLGRRASQPSIYPPSGLPHYRIASIPLSSLPPPQVCCGAQHCVAVSDSGSAYSWGWNGLGATGLGRQDQSDVTEPQLIAALSGAVRVVQCAAGLAHTLLLSELGDVYSCGWNGEGQLGHGGRGACTEPTLVEALTATVSKVWGQEGVEAACTIKVWEMPQRKKTIRKTMKVCAAEGGEGSRESC